MGRYSVLTLCLFLALSLAYADYTNVSDCTTISSGGEYRLNVSISDAGDSCLNITTSDVLIDCINYTIDGQDTGSGIFLNGVSVSDVLYNITIQNCYINDFSDGIYFEYVNNSSVFNTKVNSSADDGYYLYYSRKINLKNCSASFASGDGFYVYYSPYANSTNISSANCTAYGFHADTSNYLNVTDAVARSSNTLFSLVGVDYSAFNNTVAEYVNDGTSGRGYYLTGSDYNNFSNILSNISANDGFFLTNSDYNNISNITIEYSEDSGIVVDISANYNSFTNLTIRYSDGTATSGITCSLSGTNLTVSGLTYSAVKQYTPATEETPAASTGSSPSTSGGGSVPPFWSPSEVEIEPEKVKIKVEIEDDDGETAETEVELEIERKLISTTEKSQLITTITNPEKGGYGLTDLEFEDVIPEDFASASDILFLPSYDSLDGQAVSFVFTSFMPGEVKVIVYEVEKHVSTSVADKFQSYSFSASFGEKAASGNENEPEDRDGKQPITKPAGKPGKLQNSTEIAQNATLTPPPDETPGLTPELAAVTLVGIGAGGTIAFMVGRKVWRGRKKE